MILKAYLYVVVILLIKSIIANAMMTGGVTVMSQKDWENNEDVSKGLLQGVQLFNRMHNSMWKYEWMKVDKVTVQVVAGTKYVATVQLAPTSCRNNEESILKDFHECPFSDGAEDKTITKDISIWVRPWLNENYEKTKNEEDNPFIVDIL